MTDRDPSGIRAAGAPPAGSTALTTDYRINRGYRLYLLVALAAGAWLAWMILQSFDWATSFFLAICVACAIWSAWNVFSAVSTDTKGLTVHWPFGRAVHVDYRQFAEVAAGGRFLPTIAIIYYPLRDDGLLDLDDLLSLNLPAVEERDLLLTYLQQRMP